MSRFSFVRPALGLLALAVIALTISGCNVDPVKNPVPPGVQVNSRLSSTPAQVIIDPEVDRLLDKNQVEDAAKLIDTKLKANPKDVDLLRTQMLVEMKRARLSEAYAVYTGPLGKEDETFLEWATKHRDPVVRQQTARVLSLITTPESTTLLLPLLDDKEEKVRGAAIVALADRNDPRVAERLGVTARDDAFWSNRYDAIAILAQRGAAEPIFPALKDSDSSVARKAREALLVLVQKSPADFKPLFNKYAKDPDPRLSEVAVVGLGMVRDYASTPTVLQWLSAPEPRLRAKALKVLWFSQDPVALAEVRKKLDDPDLEVKVTALLVLNKYHDSLSLEKIKAIAKDPKADPNLRRAATKSAEQIEKGDKAPQLPATPPQP